MSEHMDKKARPLRSLKGASDDDDLLELDSRKRISLGKHAKHERYLVTDLDDGMLLLTPVIVLPVDHPVAMQLEQSMAAWKERYSAERGE
jgi:hypothetical protein